MKTTKKLAVLMPTYNVEAYIVEAIESILNQSYHDFDFIILDDASTDRTFEIIQEFAKKDERIIVYKNDDNEGIIESRNKLFDLSSHKYVALMDSDDIAMPSRFEKQVKFLDTHSKYGIVASNIKLIPLGNDNILSRHNSHAKEMMIFLNIINNPSSMIKLDYVKKHHIQYDPDYRGSSDYKFWIDLLQYTDFFILKDVLLHYRRHGTQESTFNRDRQIKNHIRISHGQLCKIDSQITQETVKRMLFPKNLFIEEKYELLTSYRRLISHNKRKKLYSPNKFEFIIKRNLCNLFKTESSHDMKKIVPLFQMRDIFTHPKLLFDVTRAIIDNTRFVKTSPQYYAKQLYRQIIQQNIKSFSIYATGEITDALMHLIEINHAQISIENLFDIKAKAGSFTHNGFKVKSPNDIVHIKSKVIVIASAVYRDDILNELHNILQQERKNYIFIVTRDTK